MFFDKESNEFQLESMEAALVVTHSDNEEEGGKGAPSSPLQVAGGSVGSKMEVRVAGRLVW